MTPPVESQELPPQSCQESPSHLFFLYVYPQEALLWSLHPDFCTGPIEAHGVPWTPCVLSECLEYFLHSGGFSVVPGKSRQKLLAISVILGAA